MLALATAASGMISAEARFDTAARDLARGADPVEAMVQTVEAKASFAADVAVAKTADQMLGSLVDVIA